MPVLHFYLKPGISVGNASQKLSSLRQLSPLVSGLNTELCYNVEISKPLSQSEKEILLWLFSPPLEQSEIQETPHLQKESSVSLLVEIGPRLNFSTPFSTNALSICKSIGLTSVVRLEVSIRYLVLLKNKDIKISKSLEDQIVLLLHDQMTECRYMEPINSFNHGIVPKKWYTVDVLENGRTALEDVNYQLGLAFDDWDLDYYTKMFKDVLKRNPTTVECFDLAQSNSEHSRHWFFKGKISLDNVTQQESLIDLIISTQNHSNPNNVIKFSDNSSAIEGFSVDKLWPLSTTGPGSFVKNRSMCHLIFTAETHNFPTGVAPFSGATTGTGGRIRDVQAVGRGGHCIAGTAGYSVGNLLIPGYEQPWEDKSFVYPSNFASPLHVIIEASNGASDYGNKFGEPVVCGYTRSYGMKDRSGERKEWVKPIMFSGGVGSMEADMVDKSKPIKGMKVVKVGGPVYRIGVGGGSASSIQVQGDNQAKLDLNAVQRGDAEMENKLNRVIRGCIEDLYGNPICSIHDQGAGGNGNVLKELVEPAGAVIFCKNFSLGDKTISTMELWGAEYQENNAILINSEAAEKLKMLAHRERCPIDIVGTVTDNGKVILSENDTDEAPFLNGTYNKDTNYPFNLDLSLVLGKMPQKVFHLNTFKVNSVALKIPELTVREALDRVFRLVTVGSKRFLTNKVDRCVTGLVAQQQCVGPLHTPIADCAVVALSMLNNEGIATAIGEQPIKGLVNPAAGARMTVAESLTNLMFATISCLKDVKCSGNWMWAAKLPGEGAALFKACSAMCDLMKQLGIAVDGGKDSLSMAARVEGETVKAPGTLVVSTYAPCPDVRKVITPDIKSPKRSSIGILLWVSMAERFRLGGSAFAQCFSQLGNECPDLDDPQKFLDGFNVTQHLIAASKILSGHDISDGGLITCVLEMAFAGLSGLIIHLPHNSDPLPTLFSEEVGWVLEVRPEDMEFVKQCYEAKNITCHFIGFAAGHGMDSLVSFRTSNGEVLLESPLIDLFQLWEETSYKLECRQANESWVTMEYESLQHRKGPNYMLCFDPENPPVPKRLMSSSTKVAVLREEGSNGDREMACSLYMAGFEVWDVVMQDFLDNSISTEMFKGIIFPGGFSYADVLGSAKGWAACLLFNDKLKLQMSKFVEREDTFSLGVCNGCQLMGLLGLIGLKEEKFTKNPDVVLDHNLSERFECRFSTVRVYDSPAIMFNGMRDSILGVWVAHGEGRFTFRDQSVLKKLNEMNCIPLKYVDDSGNPTQIYPMNPNGSIGGVAGICSPDGRHLALMPHPERCTLMWQWPYVSPSLGDIKTSPWLRIFQNAFTWVHDIQRKCTQ